MDIRGKSVVVSGGASGLGRDLVERLIRAEARVTVLDHSQQGIAELKNAQPNVDARICDVTNPEQVETAVRDIMEAKGTIDVLVNSAGVIANAPLVQFSPEGFKRHSLEAWDKVLRTNLTSVFLLSSYVAEQMILKRTKGVIINIASVCAQGNAGQSAYSAAKAGVVSLARTWSKELGVFGIRVVAISPGFIDTPSTAAALSETHLKDWVKKVPLRRLGRAQEVSELILSVVQNDFINGTNIEVDGGVTL